MIQEGDLEWFTICDGRQKGNEPIRALITRPTIRNHLLNHEHEHEHEQKDEYSNDCVQSHSSHNNTRTLLIGTGKGKVRAGIFSRQHLITTGIEVSTALPLIREAKKRNMSIVILDPNARGDGEGMVTFTKSLNQLFHIDHCDGNNEKQQHQKLYLGNKSLYILAHSQGGAQLVRYLREKETSSLIPKISALAFTDSTHSIQWVKENPFLASLLTSTSSLYLKSSNVQYDDDWENHKAGDQVETNKSWEHRFGNITTLWAGTKEHSLTNWVGRHCIWEHFDRDISNQCVHDNHAPPFNEQ